MGKITEKTVGNKTKGEKPKIHCVKCDCETRHLVLQSVDHVWNEVPDHQQNYGISGSDNYQIVQCQGCETISFRHLSWFSEAQDYDDDGSCEKLYPSKTKATVQCKDFLNVPSKIRRIHRETVDCFNLGCVTMCAAGLRAIVEGICSENEIADGPVEVKGQIKRQSNLAGKIGGLCEKGILTKTQANSLHEHRYLGNEALHELTQPSADEVKLALEIVEHTLETLYEIPDKTDELRRSKEMRKGKSKVIIKRKVKTKKTSTGG